MLGGRARLGRVISFRSAPADLAWPANGGAETSASFTVKSVGVWLPPRSDACSFPWMDRHALEPLAPV